MRTSSLRARPVPRRARPILPPPSAITPAALDIYTKLQQAGTFAASDKEYVDKAARELEKVRAGRAAMR